MNTLNRYEREKARGAGVYTRGPYKKASKEERFLKYVLKTDTCWLWQGALDGLGYGRFKDNYKSRPAYQTAYELFVGKIPDGLDLDHLCRVHSCVNPKHLEPVTHAINIQRGESSEQLRKWHASKTHCRKGHPYAGDNLKISYSYRGYFYRVCVTCQKATWARARKPKKACQ